MKHRVIEGLEELVKEKPGTLMRLLCESLAIGPEELRSRAQRLLSAILHHYSDFSIGTLDSFTHRLVKTFAFDLKLPVNFEIELDEEGFYTEVVQELIAQTGEDVQVGKLLKDYVLQQSRENASWDPEKLILEFSKLLYKEDTAPYVELLNNISDENLQEIRSDIRKTIDQFYERVRSLAADALKRIAACGLTERDFYYGKSGAVNFFTKVYKRDINLEDISKSRLSEAIDKGAWFSKTCVQTEAVEKLGKDLSRMAGELVQIIGTEYREFALCKLLEQRIYPLLLLKKIESISLERKEEAQVVFISEFNRKLFELVQHEPTPFVYERLGERYRNYLVDEFQDTSNMQWQNLLPLVDNALASGNYNLLVGDGKQSIYRWRNADVKQFTRLPEIAGAHENPLLKEREDSLKRNYLELLLDTNYRSLEQVVQFNNQLFTALSAKLLQEDHLVIYKNCAQKVAAGEGGYVSIRSYDRALQDADAFNYEQVLHHIREALAANYRYKDICILCRTNQQGQAIARYLLNHNYPVVSPDSLLLAAVPEVQVLHAFLCYTVNPDDQISAASVLSHLYGKTHINTDQYHEALIELQHKGSLPAKLRTFGFSIHEREMELLNPFDLCLYLVKAFHFDQEAGTAVRFFLDELHSWAQKEQEGLPGFLIWWERRMKKASIVVSGDADALRVMTIHVSKGLEFPVVIVPFCDWKLENKAERWLRLREKKLNLPVAALKYNKSMVELGYEKEYHDEQQSIVLDHVNLLYVAFTRAAERLHILCRAPKGEASRVNEWIFANLPEGMSEKTTGVLEMGQAQKARLRPPKKGPGDLPMKALGFAKRPFEFAIRKSARFDPGDNQALANGLLMHALLSEIESHQDIEKTITKALLQGLFDSEAAKRLRHDLESILKHKDLKTYYEPGLHLKNEAELITAEGKLLRPDRVVFKGEECVLIDYKTGKIKEKEHTRQLEQYALALEEMGHARIRKILVYLDQQEVLVLNP